MNATIQRGSVCKVVATDRFGQDHSLAGAKVVVVNVPERPVDLDEIQALVQLPWAEIAAREYYGPEAPRKPETLAKFFGVGGLCIEWFARDELEPLDENPVCPKCGQTCHSVSRLTGAAVLFRHDDTGHLVEI